MIARCEVCRGFVEVARVPGHPARVGAHPDARVTMWAGSSWWTLDATPPPIPLCSGGGREALPLLVYLAHPVAPPFVLDWVSMRNASASEHVAENCKSADRWYAWALAAAPWLHWLMPWRPIIGALPEDGGAGREQGLRIACAAAARCDVVAFVARRSIGIGREAYAITRTGGIVADLTHLGSRPPATGVDVQWPPILSG